VRALALLCAGLVSGCSVIASPSDDDIRCVVRESGVDPCREIGRWCVSGHCRPERPDGGFGFDGGCVAGEELCNGRDDDCDGVVDNGHDVDADGVTWCGGGVMALADCDDATASVHPAVGKIAAGEEVCDARDNDCNGLTDDTASCTGGLVCEAGQCRDPLDCRGRPLCQDDQECIDTGGGVFRCEDRSECSASSPCVAPRECDLVRGVCFLPPQPLGAMCTGDADCSSAVCAPGAAMDIGASISLCSQACCNDNECPAGFLCWAGRTGAKLCVPAERLGRTRGDGGAGAACTPAAPTECRSSICYASGQCAATCTSDRDCSGSNACVFADLDGRTVGLCEPPAGAHDYPEDCGAEGCRSGFCLVFTIDGFPVGEACMRGCRSNPDCPLGSSCTAAEFDEDPPLPVCVPGEPPDPAVCCNNMACGGGRCRPVSMGAYFSMRCTP
jgi:hypothetical protein